MIKFVYFDVGGVVIKDFSGSNKWEQICRDIGIKVTQDKEFWDIWNQIDDKVCIDYDIDSLLPKLSSRMGLQFKDGYSFLSDFVNRFEKNYTIWPVIESIQESSGVGLLTNMFPRMFNEIHKNGFLPNISWDRVIDSSEVKMQKPELRIFEHAQSLIDYEVNEILFVDNTKENVDVASTLGWRVYHYDHNNPEKSSKDLLQFYKSQLDR